MNTILDLNTAANVTFNNEASYAISFGTNAGNTTANVDSYASANITKQTTLNSITDAVRDLLIDVQFSNVGAVNMAYVGTWANVGLLQTAPAAWRVNGIRTVAQYNEAFANVRYTDLQGAKVTSPEYSYITTVNDQSGNTRTWNTSVNVIVQPTITVSGNLVYNEDTITPLTQVSIAVDPDSSTVFRMFANTVPTYGSMTNGIVTGNSVFIDGTVSSLNSQIAAGDIKFWPSSDFVSNVANAININLTTATTSVGTANVNIQIGSQDADYTLTTSYGYAEDDTVQMVFDITDQDIRPNISYVSTFAQTSGPTSQFYVNGVAQGYGNAVVMANTKANINVANVSFLPYPDSTANVTLAYTQVKVTPTGNITQASNVAISLTNTSSHSDYNLPTTGTYDEDTRYSFGNIISDTDTRAQSYTISLQQTSGNIGQFFRSNVLIGNANTTLNISNSKANINNTVSWQPPIDYTGNVVFTYSQSKVDVFGNTIIQANSVTAERSGVAIPDIANMVDRTVTGNTVSSIFATTTPYINDGPDYGQIYTITLNSARGNFGTSTSNALAQSTFSATGNITTINNLFGNIVFVPAFSATSGNFTYTQSRDSVPQITVTPNLTVNASAITPATYTFTNTSTFTPTLEQVLFGNARILTVGGGGAGNAYPNVVPFNNKPGSGGGGGGAVVDIVINRGTANALVQGSYDVVVGSGGATKGANGSESYLSRASTQYFVAQGGRGGQVDADNLSPWVSPGGNTYQANGAVILGGSSAENANVFGIKLGGGGAGAGQVGGNASRGAGDFDATGAKGGDGGNGIQSDISGTSTYYGGGGGGAVGFGSIGYSVGWPPGVGIGGLGGGGSGARTTGPGINPTPGTNGLGGGGGGGLPGTSETQYRGGSGIVIIKIS